MIENDFQYTITFWKNSSLPFAPSLTHDIDVDVAIIGGGFVGLSSAHALQQTDPSLSIAVLEAERVGFGASGRNAGMVVPFLHSIRSIARLFGWDEARWAARYIIEQASALKDFIHTESIACDYQRSPLIVAATNDKQTRWLKNRADELSRCGYAFEVLSSAQLRELVCYPTKSGIIIHDEHFAKLQPLALVHGFAGVIMRKGMQLYENTAARGLDIHPNKIEVLTHDGIRVTAQKLILATSVYTRKLGWGRFRLFPIAVHSYMLATEPLGDSTLGKLGTGLTSASVIDASPSFCYLRTYQNRLLFGGGDVAMFSKADKAADRDANQYRKLLAEMHKRFPFLKEIPLAAAWGDPIQTNITELPIVQSLPNAPNVVLNIAYPNGVHLSYLAGKLVVGLVLGSSFADSQAERLRRIYNATSPSLTEFLKLGLDMIA